MSQILTFQQLYDLFITEFTSYPDAPTDTNAGSLVDILGGTTCQVMSEMTKLTVLEYAKTFINSANGPEVTGGDDDLQTLATDHFGSSFARPLPQAATGEVTFSRPTSTYGNVLIPAGTVVNSKANASGTVYSYATEADVTLTGLTINAVVQCTVTGSVGNLAIGGIVAIQSTLLDSSITVSNTAVISGGTDTSTDAQYRAFIINKILSLKGATLAALEGTALAVPGVVTATGSETLTAVIAYDIGTSLPVVGATYFNIPVANIYIADANGSASPTLVAAVQAAIDADRAAGVAVTAIGAAAIAQNWTAALTLNSGGPNYASLQNDSSPIVATMSAYINTLPIGTGFMRSVANAAIMAIWGPSGTNDLTAFTTTIPVGDTAVTATQKLVAGTVATT